MNGSETWQLTKTIINKLQDFINRRLRYILGVFWPRKISNDYLWQRTKQERGEVTIRRKKWKWIGHTLRQAKKIMEKDHQANGPHKIESAGERLWRPYVPVGVDRTRLETRIVETPVRALCF